MPGNPAMDSTTSEPVMMDATAGARYPATGSSAGRNAWRKMTVCSGRPLANAVRMKWLRSTSSMWPRVRRAITLKGGRARGENGQQQMTDGTGFPACHRQPVKIDAEKQPEKWQHDE